MGKKVNKIALSTLSLFTGLVLSIFLISAYFIIIKSRAASLPPVSGGYFTTLPPGSTLPSDQECVQRVHHSSWEPRPENYSANHTIPTSISIPGYTSFYGVDNRARSYADRVSGNFTGTTDEIIQWVACKWGFNDEIVRAVATRETWWIQSSAGDIINDQSKCQTGYTAPCAQSFGLIQVKATVHPGTFPSSRDSTAFGLDYALMYRRVCFEGWITWLKSLYPSYTSGDEWGCVGQWNSGNWYDSAATAYIADVKNYTLSRPWASWADLSNTLPQITPSPTPPNLPTPHPTMVPTPTLISTDTTSPVVTIISPLSNSVIGRSLIIKSNATDNVGVTKMEIYINGSLKTYSTNSSSISYILSGKKLSPGQYTITVKAYDAAGNVGQSSVTVYK